MEEQTNTNTKELVPGPQTTEFWTTLLTSLSPWIAIFMVLGMVWSGAVSLSEATPILIALGLGGGLGGGYAVGQYNQSRAFVKTVAMNN